MKLLVKDLTQFEQEKLCNLLQCDQDELLGLHKEACSIFNKKDSIYDILLKILQQGYNVREATLIGILCGNLLGFLNAQKEMEKEIKDKLFNAFRNNKPF